MPPYPDLDHFLVDLDGRRRRLLSLVRPGSGSDLLDELTELGEQLLVADEELRVQQETLDDTRQALERLARERDDLWVSAPTPRLVTDLRGVVRMANHAAEDLIERPAVRTTPRPVATWFATPDRPAIRSIVTALTRGRPVDPVVATVRAASGGGTPVQVRARIDVDDTGARVVHWEFVPVPRGLSVVADHEAAETPADRSLLAGVAALASELGRCREPDDVVSHLTARGPELVPGAQAAGVTSCRAARAVRSHPGSDPRVGTLNAIQATTGEGPVIECATTGTTVVVSDLSHEPRWPAFAAAAVVYGIRSLVVAPMTLKGNTAVVLTVAAAGADQLGPGDAGPVSALAVHAGLALDRAATEVNLRTAVESRQQIGEAVGVLVERHRITPDVAFDLLVRASQNGNVKLRAVARDVIDTGQEPHEVVGR